MAVQAATSRYSWVVNELYSYNHPFALQLPRELATKMEKIHDSPFAFFRGTAHIFYRDMKTLPASNCAPYATRFTRLQGDMHLQNMGAIRDSAGNDTFDITDFDEGYIGPYVWDVRRIAVSILLAAEENGLSASDGQSLVRTFVDSYLSKLKDFKGNDEELNYRLVW
jgi:uncharacterized protein (DUF2252 family)